MDGKLQQHAARHGSRTISAAQLVFACLAGAMLPVAAAHAGDIDTRRTANCDVQFAGEIAEGDASKLVAALNAVDTSSTPARRLHLETEIGYFSSSYHIPRLCLDSPGGNFSEAVKFLKETFHYVSYASVIEPLAECYSACALIFLGGHLNSGDGYFEQYRRLDVSGQLGFHAPYVEPGAAPSVDPVIVGKSYRKGVEAVADLLDLDSILFPRSLLAEFLRVGSDEFLKIDQVGQLAAWSIGLTGYRRPTAITEKQIEHVCNNQRMRDNPQIYSIHMSLEPEPEQASEPIPLSDRMIVRNEQIIEGVAGCTVRARLYGDVLFLRADTTSVNAGSEENQDALEGDIITASAVAEDMTSVDPDGYTPAYFLFSPDTKIRTLKGRGDTSTQTTGTAPQVDRSVEMSVRATFWDHNGSVMRLDGDAALMRMNYENPRRGMRQVGVRKGDNLFVCSRIENKLSCTARIFHPRCGKYDFAAEGAFSDSDTIIRLRGSAPNLDNGCQGSGRKPQDWLFTYLSAAQ